MNRQQRSLLFIASFLCFASVASASPITYDVTVDTSSIIGTTGSLDFNFNPGPSVTQSASLQILNFISDGTLTGLPTLTGAVSGALPAVLTFNNNAPYNDYFGGFRFGKTISFDLSLYGPALSAPDGFSTSGSTFAFSMFSDAGGTLPVLTSDITNGFAFMANVNLDGSTTLINSSAQTTVVQTTAPVPAPSSLLLLAIGVGLMFCFGLQRQRQADIIF
jgi:hypothetical protein